MMMNLSKIIFILCLLPGIVLGQAKYTREERDKILANHRRKLEQQTEQIFQTGPTPKRSNTIYDTANYETIRDYEGQYASVNLGNQSHWSTVCGKEFNNKEPLIGIDYKRHQSRHFLLCYSRHVLVLKTFVIEHGFRLAYRDSTILNYAGQQEIRQALLFHNFQNGQLLVGLHMRRSMVSLITTLKLHDMEDGQFSLLESEAVHQFEPFENVIKIEVSHLIDSHNFVALLNAPFHMDYDKTSKNLVRIQIPEATHLETFNILTQTFIVASNSSQFHVLRVHPTKLEKVAHYGHRGRIVSVKPLVYGPNYYLLVAGEQRQGIYQYEESTSTWRGRALIHKKDSRDAGLLSCSYQREDLFFWIDRGTQTFIYTYDYDTQNFVLKLTRNRNAIIDAQFVPGSSCHFSEKDRAFEFKISEDGKLWLLGYEVILNGGGFTKRKPFWELHNIVESKLSGIQKNIVKLRRTEMISKLNTTLNFNFALKFNGKVFTKHLLSRSPKPPTHWKVRNMSLGLDDLYTDLNELQSVINARIEPHLVSLEKTLDQNVVYKSRDMIFSKTPEFVNQVKAPLIRVNHSTSIDFYNNELVSDILSNLYRSSVNPTILGRKTFASDVIVDGPFQVGLLNQRPVDSYLFNDLEQDIYTPLWYSSLDVNNLNILGPINSNLSLANVVFINQHQIPPIKLSASSMFEHLSVDHLFVNHLDNVDIRSLPSQVLLRRSASPQVFQVPTHFDVLNVERSFNTNFLNNYDSNWLFSNLAFRSGKNVFEAPVRIKGRLSLRSLDCPSVNGIRIPLDLLDRFSDQNVTGKKHFKSARFNSVSTKLFNGLRIPEDVFIASTDEFIPGKIRMDRLHTLSNLRVNGLIDGVNLTHMDQRYISSLQNHYNSLLFRKNVNVKNLHVDGLTDGFNLEEIYTDSIFTDSSRVEIIGPKRIPSILRTKNLRVLESINNERLENYARTDEELSFDGPVSLNSAQFRDVSITGKVDGVPASDLLNRIESLRNNNPIHGPKVFKNLVQVENLYVRGKINGQHSSNYMLYNAPQNITGRMLFKDVTIGRLKTPSHVFVRESLNNQNMDKFLSSLIFLENIPPLPMTFHCNNCTVGDAHADFVNNKNFTTFLNTYLSKSRPQRITGPKRFLTPQRFLNVNTTNGMAGIDIRRINQDVITLHGHNIVKNDVVLNDDLVVRSSAHLNAEFFNGRQFGQFLQDAVYINSSEKTIIRGSVQFNRGIQVQNSLLVDKINGHEPSKMFFTKTGNHSLHSQVVFHSDVLSASPLQVSGTVNGHDLKHLHDNALKQDQNGVLLGNINLVGPTQINHIQVDGTVDGSPLNRNSILFKNSGQDISKLIIDGPVTFKKDLEVYSTLNQFDSSILKRIVYAHGTNVQQIINSTKTLGDIRAPELIHRNGNLQISIINGHDILRFEQNAVYSLVNRTITKTKRFHNNVTFLSPIQIRGLFNGINLDNDIIKLNSVHSQKITGIKQFEKINLRESVDLLGTVNGINLTLLNSVILQDHGHQHIKNDVIFHSPLYLKSDSDVDYLNNVPPHDYLTLSQDQKINANVEFEHATVNRINAKIINHVNIEEVIPHLLYVRSNATQIVNGQINVNNFVVDKDLQTEEHINGIDLDVAIERATRNIHSSFNVVELRRNIDYQTTRIRSRAEMFEFANFEIEHLSHSLVDDSLLKMAQWYYPEELTRRFRVRDTLFETSLVSKGDSKVFTIQVAEPNGVRVTFYEETVVSHVSQVRAFVREGYIYLAFGVSGQHHNSTQSWLKRIPVARKETRVETVQIFDERDVTALEFFADPYGAHYLVFNSLSQTGRSLRVYKANSLASSRFEYIQSLPPLDAITLFSFGHGPTFRQFYLVGIQEFDTFVLYRHDGVFGFKTKWTARSPALSPDSITHPVIPLIVGHSKLYFKVHGCKPNIMIEAILNGALEDVQF